MLVAGVDEAGRGSVIGSLIIAGVNFRDCQIPKLKRIGVKDSKALTHRRRSILSQEIKRMAVKWEVIELSPLEVDKIVSEGREHHRLNWLEAVTMAKVIKTLHPQIAYVDASDVNSTRFGQQIRELLPFDVKIISEHRADVNYAVVGAASIIAKVFRDETIAHLQERYGNFGSGYPSDPRTKQFLSNQVRKGEIPDIVRKSWKTVKRLMENF